MDDRNRSLFIALGVIGGIIIALMLVLVVLMFTAGGGQDAVVTNTTESPTTSTTAVVTTTTEATTTSEAPATTTSAAVTTTSAPGTTSSTIVAFAGDTDTKVADSTGTPGSALTDVRLGDHSAFTRVVFDFVGEGTPAYEVGYQPGPTFVGSGGGDPKSPAGSSFLLVRIFPGLTYDVDDFTPTYLGPTEFSPGLGPIAEIVFVDDFEADMVWVIGLTAEKGFDVSTRTDPQRLVVDIEN